MTNTNNAAAELAYDRDLLADLLAPYGHTIAVVDGQLVAMDAQGTVKTTGYDDCADLATALKWDDVAGQQATYRARDMA